MRSKKIKK